MSRIVMINRLAEALNCTADEIPQGLTQKQMYWMLEHERMHQRLAKINRLRANKDYTINPALMNNK